MCIIGVCLITECTRAARCAGMAFREDELSLHSTTTSPGGHRRLSTVIISLYWDVFLLYCLPNAALTASYLALHYHFMHISLRICMHLFHLPSCFMQAWDSLCEVISCMVMCSSLRNQRVKRGGAQKRKCARAFQGISDFHVLVFIVPYLPNYLELEHATKTYSQRIFSAPGILNLVS